MVMTVSNTRAVQPFVSVSNIVVKIQTVKNDPPGVNKTEDLVAATELDMETTIPHINLLSLYLDGFRVINVTHDFGKTFSSFTINGTKIIFNEPVTGKLDAYLELPFRYAVPNENTMSVVNVQGAKSAAKTANTVLASSYCEPLILTLPLYGKVCLTDDRRGIVYIPKVGYEGFDAFSYTVITDRGQVADPKCVYVKVGSPKETK